jgi:hypothetical protein
LRMKRAATRRPRPAIGSSPAGQRLEHHDTATRAAYRGVRRA